MGAAGLMGLDRLDGAEMAGFRRLYSSLAHQGTLVRTSETREITCLCEQRNTKRIRKSDGRIDEGQRP